ncbi:MAG: cytochrome P450 [Polyangiaceae bacterium]
MNQNALPPGPDDHPFRQLYHFIKHAPEWHEDLRRRFGPYYTVRLPAQPPTVHVALPEIIKRVFESRGDDMDSGEVARPLEFLIGSQSLPLLDGARHRRARKLIMPALLGQRLIPLGATMRRIARDAIARWSPGDRIETQSFLQEIVLSVLAETLFGVPPGARQDRLKELVSKALRLAITPSISAYSFLASGDGLRRRMAHAARVLAPYRLGRALLDSNGWGRAAACVQELDELLHAELAERRHLSSERHDIMSVLLGIRDDDGQPLPDAELRDLVMGLLLAGYESTSSTLTWALSVIVDRPDILASIEEEHQRLMAGGFDPQKVRELRYLEAVLKETMRLYPIAIAPGRILRAPLRIGDHDVPAGAAIAVSVYHVQRDPSLWPDPLRFDPNRFLGPAIPPTSWFPFGGGHRTCVGMAFSTFESKILLGEIVRGLRLKRDPGPLPPLTMRGVILGPAREIGMTVVERRRTEARADSLDG